MRMISVIQTSPSEVSEAEEEDRNPRQLNDDVHTENSKSSLGFEIYTDVEQDQPKATGMRSFFRTRRITKNFEEVKESINVLEATDEKKSQSAPSIWPNIVNRMSSRFQRLRARTPDSVTAVFQKFKPRPIPGSSTNRLGSALEGCQRKQRVNNAFSSHRSGDHRIRQWNRAEKDLRKSPQKRLQASLERLRVDLKRPPTWLRTQFQRRYGRGQGPPRNRDKASTAVQESSSPQQSPQSSSGRVRSNSSAPVSRRQQEEEDLAVERSMKMDEILRLPMIQYEAKAEQQSKSCVVCTDDFKVGEILRVLTCFHTFHQGCIDEWLLNYCPWDNLICPVCKTMQYSFLDNG